MLLFYYYKKRVKKIKRQARAKKDARFYFIYFACSSTPTVVAQLLLRPDAIPSSRVFRRTALHCMQYRVGKGSDRTVSLFVYLLCLFTTPFHLVVIVIVEEIKRKTESFFVETHGTLDQIFQQRLCHHF